MFDEAASGAPEDVAGDSEPLEVRPGCWMVGRRNPEALLQCNTYLRSFEGSRDGTHVCIDPGSRFDYATIEANINQLIGDVGEVDSFTINHQDPDVVGNAPALCEANVNCSAIVTEEAWRLVRHLDFQPRRVHFPRTTRTRPLTIADEHTWYTVPTPFCHFRGAVAYYDPELRTLFSGDLFGGLNQLGRVHLFAEEADWAGVAQFHQIYMPGRSVLQHAVRQIRALTPPVEVIAPQHGFVIQGELVGQFLEWLSGLLVGADLLAAELDDANLEGYREALAGLLERAGDLMGRQDVLSRLRAGDVPDDLPRLINVRGADVRLECEGYTAIPQALARLTRGEPLAVANALRSEVLEACTRLGLPIPPVGAGLEEGAPPASIGPDGIRLR